MSWYHVVDGRVVTIDGEPFVPRITTEVPPAPDFSGPVRIDLGDGNVVVGYLDREPPPPDHDGITFTYSFTPQS